jgi:uncharacterized protein DUF6962
VTIQEPMTLATDYLLAAACGCFSMLLFRMKSAATGWWCIAFAAVAAAALAGGTHHGFPSFHPHALWKTTLVAAGAASCAMVIAAAVATRVGPQLFFWLAVLKLAAYLGWIASHDDFLAVVIDSGSALLVVATLHAIRGDAAWRWMIGGVAVAVAAAGVQAMRLAPHPHFNHNDLYHVIQIAAMWLFYRGARQI